MFRITLDGDPNTNVGTDNTECEDIMGRHVPGKSYIDGKRLVDDCVFNSSTIGDGIFTSKCIHEAV